jgi:hypothetical protein
MKLEIVDYRFTREGKLKFLTKTSIEKIKRSSAVRADSLFYPSYDSQLSSISLPLKGEVGSKNRKG